MKKYNYVLLGVAISYTIIAIIQWRMPTPLNASIYITLSFLSLNVSIFETIKAITNKIYSLSDRCICFIDSQITLREEKIKMLDLCHGSEEKKEELELEITTLEKEKKDRQLYKRVATVKKVEQWLTAFEIVFCTCLVILSQLKVIPYDNKKTKMINCSSLFSFAFLFISLVVSNIEVDESEWSEKHWIESASKNTVNN